MKLFDKLHFGVFIVSLFVGFVIGLIVRDVPVISFDTSVGVADLASIGLSLVALIVVSILFAKWKDDHRYIKNFLITELTDFAELVFQVKLIVDNACHEGSTSGLDKQRIRSYLEDIRRKLDSLIEQLNTSFPANADHVKNCLRDKQFAHWTMATSGDFLNDDYHIDDEYKRRHDGLYWGFETTIKKCVHDLNGW